MNVPDNVKRVINSIRRSGVTNMLDKDVVIMLAEDYDKGDDVSAYLNANRHKWVSLLEACTKAHEVATWLND